MMSALCPTKGPRSLCLPTRGSLSASYRLSRAGFNGLFLPEPLLPPLTQDICISLHRAAWNAFIHFICSVPAPAPRTATRSFAPSPQGKHDSLCTRAPGLVLPRDALAVSSTQSCPASSQLFLPCSLWMHSDSGTQPFRWLYLFIYLFPTRSQFPQKLDHCDASSWRKALYRGHPRIELVLLRVWCGGPSTWAWGFFSCFGGVCSLCLVLFQQGREMMSECVW